MQHGRFEPNRSVQRSKRIPGGCDCAFRCPSPPVWLVSQQVNGMNASHKHKSSEQAWLHVKDLSSVFHFLKKLHCVFHVILLDVSFLPTDEQKDILVLIDYYGQVCQVILPIHPFSTPAQSNSGLRRGWSLSQLPWTGRQSITGTNNHPHSHMLLGTI